MEHASINYEQSIPGRWVVLATPQIAEYRKDYYNRWDPNDESPSCELLLPTWVPDGADPDAPPSPEPIGVDASAHAKADWLARKHPPHTIVPVSSAGYVPTDHRPHPTVAVVSAKYAPNNQRNRDVDLGDGFEWATVVISTRSGMYRVIGDTEFTALNDEDREHLQVLGQVIRPTDQTSPFMHESRTLLGLFGLDEKGNQQISQPSNEYAAVA